MSDTTSSADNQSDSDVCANPHCTCGDSCACGSGCQCGVPASAAPGAPARDLSSCDCGDDSPRFTLLVGAMAGTLIPIIVGVIAGAIIGTTGGGMDMSSSSHMSSGMQGDHAWFGNSVWYYGSMAVVLTAGLAHSLVSSNGRSCGSTPIGMGLMWGSMASMAIGMAAGMH